ncbi:hypothetical protein, partial [Klebsiella pneumoniae]|uniref:hypothetical protein n=1 Tax=Klebsiella pneumoniae TaxID=573 RepID=UPI0035630FAF
NHKPEVRLLYVQLQTLRCVPCEWSQRTIWAFVREAFAQSGVNPEDGDGWLYFAQNYSLDFKPICVAISHSSRNTRPVN